MVSVHSIFVVLNYISVFVMLGSFIILSKQNASRMQKLAMAVSFSLFICCIGFLFRIEAKSVEGLILGQKLVYSFVTFGMFYMLLFILAYCEYRINKIVLTVFECLNALMTVAVLTLDHHKLFYKSYWLVQEDGFVSLEKEYGILHTVAIVLFAFYMAAALVITVIYSAHNIKRKSHYVWRLLLAVVLPCASYIVPKVLDLQNDWQPMAFAAFTLVILYMIYKHNLYDVDNITARLAVQTLEEAVIVIDEKENLQGCNQLAKELIPELKDLNLDDNIRGKTEMLDAVIGGCTEDVQIDDRIFAISVSPVKNSENRLLGTVIRLRDETLNRKYTALLKAQQESLTSRVETLSDFSYKDDLTGCRNRRSCEDALSVIRDGGMTGDITVWAIDVNGLKSVNDTKGHVAGDELIRAAGSLLTGVFGSSGTVYRTGGDEFVVLARGSGTDNADMTLRVEKACADWKGVMTDRISLAVGFAAARDLPESSIDDLMFLADKNMYENKRRYYEKTGIRKNT